MTFDGNLSVMANGEYTLQASVEFSAVYTPVEYSVTYEVSSDADAMAPEPFAAPSGGKGPSAGIYAAVIVTILGVMGVVFYLIFVRK